MGVVLVKAAFGAVLGLSIARAFFGPPPPGPVRGGGACALLGATAYAAGMAVAVGGSVVVACVLVGLAVEALSLAVWLARGRDDRPPDDGDPDSGDGDPPVDWARFDRERERWSRPRDRTPAA